MVRPIEHILARLEGVQQRNGYHVALCPAHDDHRPSLTVKEGDDGRTLVYCHANCPIERILDALGLGIPDLFERPEPNRNGHRSKKKKIVECYDYSDADGRTTVMQTVRYEPKDFRQRRPDGRGGWEWNLDGVELVLYRLPDVLSAVAAGETVYVVEGEKDADRLRALGITATTSPMGAGKWRDPYSETLRGANVVILPDNDKPGREHGEQIARRLLGKAANVKVLNLPGLSRGGDVSDWLGAGGTAEELARLAQEAPVWQPENAEIHSDHPTGRGFGQNGSLPLKSPKEIVEAAKDGTDWIVRGFLAPGEITDLAGTAKQSGKTTFITHMLVAEIKGEEFLGLRTRKAKVLYLTEQGNNFANALKKSGLVDAGDALRIVQYRDLDGKSSWWPNLIKSATEVCKSNGFEVLVIDTFAGLSGLRGTEENNVGDILEKMAPLKTAAQKHGLAVLVARHADKDGRGRGSSMFEGEVDIVLTLGRPEGNHKGTTARVLEGVGRHDDIPARMTIELTDDGYVSLGSDDRIDLRRAVEAVRDVMPRRPDEAMTEEEILDVVAEDVSRTTARRALKELMEQAENPIKREGEGKKGDPYRYWQPAYEKPPL